MGYEIRTSVIKKHEEKGSPFHPETNMHFFNWPSDPVQDRSVCGVLEITCDNPVDNRFHSIDCFSSEADVEKRTKEIVALLQDLAVQEGETIRNHDTVSVEEEREC